MVYRPPFIKQLDGSTFASQNCTVASACMAAIRHRRGSNPPGTYQWYPTPKYIRSIMGDRSGGTNLAQNDYVFTKYYGINFEVMYYLSWSSFVAKIKEGRGAVLQGSYVYWAGTKYDGSRNGFKGNHAVYVNEHRYYSGRLQFLVYDPLWDGRRSGIPRAPMWVDEYWLKKFAGALMLTTSRIGYGKCYAAFTADTENTTTQSQVPTLKWNGVAYGPRMLYARVSGARVRERPSTSRTAKILRTLAYNQGFAAYQTTHGQYVYGSDVWYGSRAGLEWVHSSVLKLTR